MASGWLICREPVHIGGADSSSRGNNNPIYRLPDRTPVIPGSSLRGALREEAEHNTALEGHVSEWFGGREPISPGNVSLGWGWPVWWPVHVLGYGNWWISCPSWLNRFQQLSHRKILSFDRDKVYISEHDASMKSVYLRWLKLTNLSKITTYQEKLEIPQDVEKDRLIIVPDNIINVIVDMGLVRQPRVSLLDEQNDKGNLVKNLFAVEGFPPGAVFMINWTIRREKDLNPEKWTEFLNGEHFLGGLWGIGYGKIYIQSITSKEQKDDC